MSRSLKKNPIAGAWSCPSEKTWKTNLNRRLRHKVRLILMADPDSLLPDAKSLNVSDGFRPKDIDGFGDCHGKIWYGWDEDKWPNRKLMRK